MTTSAPPEPPFVPCVLDNSVVARLERGEIDRTAVLPYMQDGNYLATCAPQLLEVLYSTRSAAEWQREYLDNWAFVHVLHPDQTTHAMAVEIQRRLWRTGRVRAAGTADIMIAAVAIRHDAIVVHRDSDYERIAEVAPEFRQVRV